jgi:hypothetical protein
MQPYEWKTRNDIPEKYYGPYCGGVNWCCDGGLLNGNPYPPFTGRHHAFRVGWIEQNREIKEHGRILTAEEYASKES